MWRSKYISQGLAGVVGRKLGPGTWQGLGRCQFPLSPKKLERSQGKETWLPSSPDSSFPFLAFKMAPPVLAFILAEQEARRGSGKGEEKSGSLPYCQVCLLLYTGTPPPGVKILPLPTVLWVAGAGTRDNLSSGSSGDWVQRVRWTLEGRYQSPVYQVQSDSGSQPV